MAGNLGCGRGDAHEGPSYRRISEFRDSGGNSLQSLVGPDVESATPEDSKLSPNLHHVANSALLLIYDISLTQEYGSPWRFRTSCLPDFIMVEYYTRNIWVGIQVILTLSVKAVDDYRHCWRYSLSHNFFLPLLRGVFLFSTYLGRG